MPIVVETGANIAGANSYFSQATFEAYCEAHGYSIAGKTDDEIESAIIRGTSWIDNTYRQRWPGVRTYGATQSLLWPRKAGVIVNGIYYQSGYLATVTDSEGLAIAINAIPAALVSAAAEAAYRELMKPGSLAPDLARGGAIKGVRAGSVAIDYSGKAPPGTTFSVIDGLLGGLLVSAEISAYTGRAVRA